MTNSTPASRRKFLWMARLLPSLLVFTTTLGSCTGTTVLGGRVSKIPGSEVLVEWLSPTHVRRIRGPKDKVGNDSNFYNRIECDSLSEPKYEVVHPYGIDGFLPMIQVATAVATPIYPPAAALYYIEATVTLKVLVDADGIVREAKVLEDSGTELGFERAALESAMLCTYTHSSARINWHTSPVEFRIKKP